MKREIIHQKYDGHCAYCGKVITIKEMQIDHVEPKANGGTDDIDNLNPACKECNNYKGSANIEEWRYFLDQLFTNIYRLFKSKTKMQVAINFGVLRLGNWDGKFYYERGSNPLSCVGCKYYNTLDDDLCGTCGDNYQNKTEKIIN